MLTFCIVFAAGMVTDYVATDSTEKVFIWATAMVSVAILNSGRA